MMVVRRFDGLLDFPTCFQRNQLQKDVSLSQTTTLTKRSDKLIIIENNLEMKIIVSENIFIRIFTAGRDERFS